VSKEALGPQQSNSENPLYFPSMKQKQKMMEVNSENIVISNLECHIFRTECVDDIFLLSMRVPSTPSAVVICDTRCVEFRR
jgi:hypothetical protein